VSASSDLAGKGYWDKVWQRSGPRFPVGRFTYFHRSLSRVFARYVRAGTTVCEVGCADSVWVPYLIDQGANVAGLDYSETGVDRLREALARQGMTAALVIGDVFNPESMPQASFDVVFSLGLVEHFTDGVSAVRAVGGLVKPGGVLITVIPNLVGTWGAIQQRLDRSVFDVHLLYDPAGLDQLHARAGYRPVEPARYFGGFGPLVMNAPALEQKFPRSHKAVLSGVWLVQQALAWPLGLLFGRGAESRALSSHIIGVYQRSN
jgi:SAM-dependent methyltransferase